MKKWIGNLIFLSVIAIMLFGGVCVYGDNKNDSIIIKVGYFENDNIFQDNNGEYSGYEYDLLKKVEDNSNIKLEFVKCSWDEAIEKIENGQIDLMLNMYNYTDEKKYILSSNDVLSSENVMYVNKDKDNIYFDDFDAFNNMNIGVIKGSDNDKLLENYSENKNFECNIKYYDNTEKMQKALVNGEIDGMVDLKIISDNKFKPITYISHYDINFMAKEKNDKIANFEYEINNTYYENKVDLEKLYDEYFENGENSLMLTREEAELIAKKKVYTVGNLPERYPMSSADRKGNVEGIYEDILSYISEITGLQFDLQALAVKDKPVNALKEGKFDLVAGMLRTQNYLDDNEIELSNPFYESTLAIVMKKGQKYNPENDYTIVLMVAFQAMHEYIAEKYPNYNVVYGNSTTDCLDMVLDGKADIFLQNVYVMNYHLQSPKYEKLEVLPTSFMTEKNCVIVMNTEENQVLLSIINKAIDMIPQSEMNRIVIKNTTSKPYQFSFEDLMYKYKIPITIIAIMVIICIMLLSIIIITRQRNLKVVKRKNQQLAEAVLQAKQANTAKSQFLSRMSHEIRTPMNAIVGITTIAKTHKNEPDKIDDYLSKIDSSSKVLLNIINDVLDMSAIESAKLKIASAEFDIKTVLTGISTIYYTQCKVKNIDFTMVTNIEDEILIGDSLRVSQILLNLVSNAYKFTESGGKITISVTQTAIREEKVYIKFVVSDTGCGMSEEMKERLFKPFEQESAQTAKKHGGSGLGMSIAKNLIDMMHGAISVESEKDIGTTFSVELPFGYTGKDSEEVNEDKIKNLRVLVVDDDMNARDYVSIVLERIGVDYDISESGEEALEMMEYEYSSGYGYDVCLIDWKMPGLNGIEVTKKIREKYDEDMLIIILSAYDLSEVEDDAKNAGANVFVTKPIFQSTIYNLFMQISGGKYINKTGDQSKYDFTGKKVLLAEDIPLLAEVASELLKMVNVIVEVAENGQEVVDKFTSNEPGTYDIILMDIQMPILDGYEATKKIRESNHPEAKTISIYAMTANAFTEDVSAAFSAGMNGHIAKPIDTNILYQTLEDTFNKQK